MANKIQKMFYFSDEDSKQLIENRINDLSVLTHRSNSFIIENILLDGLFPQNKDAKYIVRYNLYADDNQRAVKKTLEAIFLYNANKSNWKAKHENLKPLVEFCIYYSSSMVKNEITNTFFSYLTAQLESIIERINNCIPDCMETYDREMYTQNLKTSKILLKELEDNSTEINPKYHFQLILDCWEMLDDWTITYRYLENITKISNFEENAFTRNELHEIINEISKSW